MNSKRALMLFLSFIIIFSFTACQKADKADTTQESSTADASQAVADIAASDTATQVLDSSSDLSQTAVSAQAEESSVYEETSTKTFDDPTEWSKEQIVAAYKNAAKESNAAAKSEQNILLKSISVNNGEYEGLFEFITPIMSKLLANNSTEKDGITGGYNNLTATDAASAKAYKSGNNTVIELVMREQTSGARDDALSGTVGHAITAVGDIGVVTNQLKDLGLPLELSEKDTKIYYTNPTVKVLINSDGEIINGTWQYTVEISLNNYKAFGKTVNTTSVIMDNIITVNGGFKK